MGWKNDSMADGTIANLKAISRINPLKEKDAENSCEINSLCNLQWKYEKKTEKIKDMKSKKCEVGIEGSLGAVDSLKAVSYSLWISVLLTSRLYFPSPHWIYFSNHETTGQTNLFSLLNISQGVCFISFCNVVFCENCFIIPLKHREAFSSTPMYTVRMYVYTNKCIRIARSLPILEQSLSQIQHSYNSSSHIILVYSMCVWIKQVRKD